MPELAKGIAQRRLSSLLDERAADEPVIALHGPRSVGKSTVLSDFAKRSGVTVIDLDDPATQDAGSSRRIAARSSS